MDEIDDLDLGAAAMEEGVAGEGGEAGGPGLGAAFVERRVLPLQGRPHMIC